MIGIPGAGTTINEKDKSRMNDEHHEVNGSIHPSMSVNYTYVCTLEQ